VKKPELMEVFDKRDTALISVSETLDTMTLLAACL
jgi:hypothetical protein